MARARGTRPSMSSAATKPAYCKQHTEDGVVDFCSRRCSHDSCRRHAALNAVGRKNPVYCTKKSENGMVGVGSRRCSHDSCPTHPSFNTAGSKYLRQHAESGMVYTRSKQSSHDSCIRFPEWGVLIFHSIQRFGLCVRPS